MAPAAQTKTDYIKFNISPVLKAHAEKKARQYGMTLSELGRMLFGSFITGVSHPQSEVTQKFAEMAEQAKKDHQAGKGTLITNDKELESYLSTL